MLSMQKKYLCDILPLMNNPHAVALGKKRWENKSEQERSEHGKLMRAARKDRKKLSTDLLKQVIDTTASKNILETQEGTLKTK